MIDRFVRDAARFQVPALPVSVVGHQAVLQCRASLHFGPSSRTALATFERNESGLLPDHSATTRF